MTVPVSVRVTSSTGGPFEVFAEDGASLDAHDAAWAAEKGKYRSQ